MPKSKHARRLGTKRTPNSKLDQPQPAGPDASHLRAHSQPPSRDATTQQAHSQPPPRDDTIQPTHSQSLPPEAHLHPTYSQLAPSDVPSASQDLTPKSKRPRRLGTKKAPITELDPSHPTPPLLAHSQPPSRDATIPQMHSQPPPGDDTTQPIHSQSLPPDAHPHPTYSQLAPKDGPSTSQDPVPKSKYPRPRRLGTKRAHSTVLGPPHPTGQDFPSLPAHSQPPSRDATIQLAHTQLTPRDDTAQVPMSQRRRRLGTKRAPSTKLDTPHSTGRDADAPPLLGHSQPLSRDVTTQQAHSQSPPRDDTTQQSTHSQSLTPDVYPHPTYSQPAPTDGPSTSQDPMPKSKRPKRVGTKRAPGTKLDPLHPTGQDAPPLPAHSRPPSRDADTQQAHSQTPPRDDTTQPTHTQYLSPDAHPHPPYSQLAPGDGSTSQDPVQGNEDINLDLVLRQIINELLPTPSLKIPTTNYNISPNSRPPTNKSLRKIPKSKRPKLKGVERAPSTRIDPPHPTCQDAPPLLTHSQPPSRASITKQARSQRTPSDATTQPTHSQSLPRDVHPHPLPTYPQDAPGDDPSTSQDAVQDTQLGSDTETDDTETYYSGTSYRRTKQRSSWACQVRDKDAVIKGKNLKVKQSQRAHSQPPPSDATTQPMHSQSSPQDVHPHATYSQHAPRDSPSTSQDPGHDTQLGSDTETDDTETNDTKTNHKQTKQRSSWACKVIDKDGVMKEKNLKVRQVWRLKYEKVVVECDKEGRPVEDVGGLFSGVVGRLARTKFPIDVKTWRHVTNSVKDDCIDRFIMPYFHFENEKLGRRFTKQALGRRWRDYRLSLYNAIYDPSMSKEQNIDKNCPRGITKQEWAGYIDIRDDKKHKEMCKKNAENRSKQFIPHTGGSMSFARKKRQMEKESGQLVGRVKLWDATHRKKNGTYVNDKAKEVADKLNDALSQEDPSRHSVISPDDALGKVFGREHPGRVRGLGFGVCPTSVFENTMQRLGGVHLSYISSSSHDPKIQEEVQTLKCQLNETQDKLNQTQDKVRFWESAFLSYIQEKEGYIPHQFASLVSSTQQV